MEPVQAKTELDKVVDSVRAGNLTMACSYLGVELSHRYDTHIICEYLMHSLLQRNADGSHGKLLSAVADCFIGSFSGRASQTEKLFTSWSHSLCHLFENYGRPERDQASLLDFPHQYEVATRLIDALVKSALTVRSDSCVDRTLGALFRLNKESFSEQTLKDPFVFKPAVLSQEGFPELIGEVLGTFCAADTPYEFFEKILPVGNQNEYSKTLWPTKVEPELAVFLLQEFRDRIPETIMNRYLQEFPELDGKVQTVDELKDSISQAAAARVVENGIFVDVDGTLIIEAGTVLNTALIRALQRRQEAGETVTCFTGGDPERAADRLWELGCPESLLPVRSKSEFRGKLLELVIDDVSPGYQGFGAISYLQPPYMWIKKDLVREGDQWRFESVNSEKQ